MTPLTRVRYEVLVRGVGLYLILNQGSMLIRIPLTRLARAPG